MSYQFTIYDPETGRLLGHISYPEPRLTDMTDKVISGTYDPEGFYYDISSDSIKRRPKTEASISTNVIKANGSDCVIIENIPPGSTVTVNGVVFQLSHKETKLVWSTVYPGIYHFSIDAFPYTEWEAEVTVQNE